VAAVWQKNEVTATKRRADLIVLDDSGAPASPGLDFIALGMVFISGTASPNYALALGTLTNKRRPLVVADDTFTADHTTETFTATAHGLQTGDGPIRVSSTTTLPAGLSAGTDYWVIKVTADTFKLATSLANAYAGTNLTITDNGTGTHTLSDTTSTQRGIWGEFTYEATQAETNHDAPETVIIVDGSGYARMNSGGAYTTVNMESSASDWGSVAIEGSHTRDDLLRGIARQNLGNMIVSGSSYTTRDLANSKNSHHGTIDASGRSGAIDDLT
jgi:hypothetical protein